MSGVGDAARRGQKVPRVGPGGLQTLMTPGEALATADQMTAQAEALFEAIIARKAMAIAAQIAVGQLEVRQAADGGLEVGPPVRPEFVS